MKLKEGIPFKYIRVGVASLFQYAITPKLRLFPTQKGFGRVPYRHVISDEIAGMNN
jgi:hypothetical protein